MIGQPKVDTKATLRQRALARRTSMAAAEHGAATAAIAERAGAVIAALRPPRVSVYWPIGSECGTQALIEKVDALGAVIGLPAVADEKIVFRRFVPGGRLIAGRFGTREPPGDAPVVQPDVIVLPVVAFDRQGWRLGYGRGYYDRAISAMRDVGQRPHLLGIAFSVQEVETIPAEPHDARLDCLVTENETLNFLVRGA